MKGEGVAQANIIRYGAEDEGVDRPPMTESVRLRSPELECLQAGFRVVLV